jgi:hypothetical protein
MVSKIIWLIFILAAPVLFAQDSLSFASQRDTCIIINDVYLRKLPDVKSETITIIDVNQKVLVMGASKNYCLIQWKDFTGWVNTAFLNCPKKIEESIGISGDFTLSTYKWEWVPYMMGFKNKLQRVWYAPVAYSQLHLISGYTIVRFKIARDGQLIDLQVLRQVGHSSLEKSSINAIKNVFPFQPLPGDFPDEYLELTVKMIYPKLREFEPDK